MTISLSVLMNNRLIGGCNMKVRTIMVILVLTVFSGAVAIATQNYGGEEIKLDGGRKGMIDFPHHQHHRVISDCNTCHAVFPKTAGSIKDLKIQGKLKKKQVMNNTCLKCHKAMKKAGEKTGPTKCSACHVK